jgi:nitric oxide synthase oxygenase domain/subunit
MKTRQIEDIIKAEVDAFIEATEKCRKTKGVYTDAELYHAARMGWRAAEKAKARGETP